MKQETIKKNDIVSSTISIKVKSNLEIDLTTKKYMKNLIQEKVSTKIIK